MALASAVDRELLARLRRVGLSARHAVAALQAGAHRSLHRGLSLEFAGHRPYQPGDDLRRLDWLVWARSDRDELRLYQEETRLRATLVLDASGSMAYGERWRTAQLVAAALALVMAGQGDAVGLVIGDSQIRRQLPPATGMGHLLRVLAMIEESEAIGGTGLPTLLEDLAPQLSRRGLVGWYRICCSIRRPWRARWRACAMVGRICAPSAWCIPTNRCCPGTATSSWKGWRARRRWPSPLIACGRAIALPGPRMPAPWRRPVTATACH